MSFGVQGAASLFTEEDAELEELVEAIWQHYGYDFRDYARAAFKRRIVRVVHSQHCASITDLRSKILGNPDVFYSLLNDLTLTVTEMFRDATVYKALRSEVFPHLRTYPELKIWHAGCSTGEEVYSLAILLKEEGLYDRSVIYATDINPVALRKSREGILPVASLREASPRYFASGGTRSLSDYYSASYNSGLLDASLRKNVVFADHNLVTDGTFLEMHLILCRNVLIYFNRALQDKVIQLFADSLAKGGFLCLGARESLPVEARSVAFEEFNRKERVYRRVFFAQNAKERP